MPIARPVMLAPMLIGDLGPPAWWLCLRSPGVGRVTDPAGAKEIDPYARRGSGTPGLVAAGSQTLPEQKR